MIDLAPTCLDYLILEGCSLLRAQTPLAWRGHAISEYDFGADIVRLRLDVPLDRCRPYMITVPDEWFTGGDDKMRHFDPLVAPGVLIGYWDEADLAEQREGRREWLGRNGKG